MTQIDPVDRIATATWLDRAASAMRAAVATTLRSGRVKDALHGVWLGHPLHPALAQFPVGCFTGAAVLDLTGARDGHADRLIRWGLLGSVPAALAGLADYAEGHEEQQRIGLVHAAANVSAIACYLGSLRLRSSGLSALGVASGLVAYGLAAGAAAIGGDLSFRWASGPNHAAEVPHAGPADWTDLGAVAEFADGEAERRMAGLIPVMVLAGPSGFVVLHDRCSHMAAPLHQGEITSTAGADCVVCPWHGSVFRLADGAVVHGPATAPQPVLDTRIQDGRLQAKVREIPGVAAS
ncbi:MAG TPA: Rieske (2Fe-2S) protein [Pseudonocardiaceae bacterium]|nr:Rieske (2Fe-2S) protein [Pseudonocardiaceae bacterium]